MLNIGPRGDGSVPERAARSLRAVGEWIRRYPQVVYGADASPWGRALPWGDVTVGDNKLFLSVYEWPASGRLYLPGLQTPIASARVLKRGQTERVDHESVDGWTVFQLPLRAPEEFVSVIELELEGEPKVGATWGVDPDVETEILAEFAHVEGADLSKKRWMEKFGEWKAVEHVSGWSSDGKATWEVSVLDPGDYNVSLTYSGEGRLVWGVDVEGGEHIQNQQNSSHNYQEFPIGWIRFPEAGKYKVSVSCLEGDLERASLKSIHFLPIEM